MNDGRRRRPERVRTRNELCRELSSRSPSPLCSRRGRSRPIVRRAARRRRRGFRDRHGDCRQSLAARQADRRDFHLQLRGSPTRLHPSQRKRRRGARQAKPGILWRNKSLEADHRRQAGAWRKAEKMEMKVILAFPLHHNPARPRKNPIIQRASATAPATLAERR